MKVAELIALSGIALPLSVSCGSDADALVNGHVTDARQAVGTVMIVTERAIPSAFPRASCSST